MRKAVVLGGGGSVGTAWQTALNAGWNREGIDLSDSNLILGTSAGAAVGVQVALGHDLDVQLERYEKARERVVNGGETRVLHFGDAQRAVVDELFEIGHARGREDPMVRRRICDAAAEAKTMSQEEYLLTVKYLRGEDWPLNYSCPVVNLENAEVEVLDSARGFPLDKGVCAAIAVPAVYPAITLDGTQYVEGGVLSTNYLDLAAGYDRVLFVQMTPVPARELDAVEASGAKLLTISPDEHSLEAFGGNLMDRDAAFRATKPGLEQGLRTAGQVKEFWSADLAVTTIREANRG